MVRLRAAWGNEGFSAEVSYLEAVGRHLAATDGPVLECGSGLTTVLIAALAARRGIPAWTLEHDAAWRALVVRALRRLRLPPVEVELAPLREYGAFSWYAAPLERMPRDFAVVVCDGPPGDTRGGRIGLLTVMRSHLRAGAVVLLDDAHRESERAVIDAWCASGRCSAEIIATPGGTYGRIVVNAEGAPAEPVRPR